MARRPTLKQLDYLCAVASLKHFSQAAGRCHVSQSTLSAGILELEQTLDIPLIERNNKRVLLTPVGEEIVKRATNILTDIDDLVSVATAAQEPFTGTLRLGVIPTIAPYMLPKLLPRLRKEYPKLQLLIREDLSGNLAELLKQGQLDVILLALPFPIESCVTHHLFYDSLTLAYTKSHPLASAKTLTPKDLKGQDLLLLEEGHCLREHVLSACKLKKSDIEVPYYATSLNTIVQMIASGIGITLLPRMALGTNILAGTDVKTRDFKQHNISRSIGLTWRKNSPHQETFKMLGKFIQNHHTWK